jgi:hypothetical protein
MDKWEAAKEEVLVHQLALRRQGACMSQRPRPGIVWSTIGHILSGGGVMGGNMATTERESPSRGRGSAYTDQGGFLRRLRLDTLRSHLADMGTLGGFASPFGPPPTTPAPLASPFGDFRTCTFPHHTRSLRSRPRARPRHPSRDGAPPARARAKRAGRAGLAVRPEGPAGFPRDRARVFKRQGRMTCSAEFAGRSARIDARHAAHNAQGFHRGQIGLWL